MSPVRWHQNRRISNTSWHEAYQADRGRWGCNTGIANGVKWGLQRGAYHSRLLPLPFSLCHEPRVGSVELCCLFMKRFKRLLRFLFFQYRTFQSARFLSCILISLFRMIKKAVQTLQRAGLEIYVRTIAATTFLKSRTFNQYTTHIHKKWSKRRQWHPKRNSPPLAALGSRLITRTDVPIGQIGHLRWLGLLCVKSLNGFIGRRS